jgi:hypothetical protein
MTGQYSDYILHGQLEFGEYVQIHESHDNSMSTRTTGAIALRPTGNTQGGYYFMSLSSGHRVNRYAWTALPMPGEVIERVQHLARRNPAGGDIAFGWRDGTPIVDAPTEEDALHDADYDPLDDSSSSESGHSSDGSESEDDDPSESGGEGNDAAGDDGGIENAVGVFGAGIGGGGDGVHAPPAGVDDNGHGADVEDDIAGDADDVPDDDADDVEDDIAGDADDVPDDDADDVPYDEADEVPNGEENHPATAGVEAEMDTRYGARRRGGMRPRKLPRSPGSSKVPRSAAHHALNSLIGHELGEISSLANVDHVALTQYNLKGGLQLYGEAATNAVIKEMKQLHDRKTIRPRESKELTVGEKRKALAYLMF